MQARGSTIVPCSPEAAFAFVSKAVALGARDAGFPVADGFRQRSVTVAAPVRIDFGFPVETDSPLAESWRVHILLGPDI